MCFLRTNNETCPCQENDCQPPTEQYWEQFVLGIHEAPSATYNKTLSADNDTMVKRTYILDTFGEIG